LLEIGLGIGSLIIPQWFRITVAGIDEIVMPASRELIFRIPPGRYYLGGREYSINSFGWRGPEAPGEKSPREYRIMFLGDSSVWGEGLPRREVFPWLVASEMGKKLSRPVVALNAATPGYSSTQCRIILDDYIDKVNPDAVVIAAIWSDIIVRPFTDRQWLDMHKEDGYSFDNSFPLALRKSAIFRFFESRIISIKGIPSDRRLALNSIIGTKVEPGSVGTPRVPAPDHLENLKAMAKTCKEKEILLCLLMLPIDEKIFPWPKGRLESYQRNFYSVALEFDGVLVDSYKVFSNKPDSGSRLFIDGLHPNKMGHEIIANKLTSALIDRINSPGK